MLNTSNGNQVGIDDAASASVLSSRTVPGMLEAVGGLGGIGPFFVSFVSSHSVTIDGVTQITYRDYGALAGGGIAVISAILSFALLGRVHELSRSKARILALGVLALGIFQILRGLGFLVPGGH